MLAGLPAGLDLRRPEEATALANWIATIAHGVRQSLYRFTPEPADGGYLAFLGRISPEKRPDRAIAIAKRTGLRLKIAAKVDAADRAYFAETIEPLLGDPLIEFVGEIGDAQKSAFLGNARALLFPIDWPEPFGLRHDRGHGLRHAVVAWRCGSVPEIIDEGDRLRRRLEDEAVAAVERAASLDRHGPCHVRAAVLRDGDGAQLCRALPAAGRHSRPPSQQLGLGIRLPMADVGGPVFAQ